MGGGDLNTKKSWHPSTMRNIEKVWKAEQRSEQEKKRIAELQREIKDERQREEITKFAQDQGVIEKKDDNRLTWMYQGPSGSIDQEDYLLGKRIDKTFEDVKASERSGTTTSTSADYGCIPASIFSYKGNSQIDTARKIQEDPLYMIKKKEMESWSKLLNNPVKMKNLQKMAEHVSKSKKSKHSKKSKKRHKRSRSSSESSSDSSDSKISEKDLDKLLAKKYSQLKGKVDVSEILEVKKSKDSSFKHSKGRRRSRSRERSMSDDDSVKRRQWREGAQRSSDSRHREGSNTRESNKQSFENSSTTKKMKMSDEEKQRKLREMMDNAKWREDDRTRKVSKYREEEKTEETGHLKAYNSDFLRKQLSKAADQSTVEGRVKANIYKNQRSHAAMDKSFARR